MKSVVINVAQFYGIVLEKLIVFCCIYKSPQLDPILSQWNLIHSTTYASHIHPPSRSKFSQWSFHPI